VRYQLASSATSLVAVEERAGEQAQERGQLVLVPQALTRGWHGAMPSPIQARSITTACGARFSERPRPQAMEYMRPSGVPDRAWNSARRVDGPQGPPPAWLDRPFAMVVQAQRADGSWRLDDRLATALGIGVDALRHLARRLAGVANADAVVATTAALVFLRTRAANRSDEWRLLAEKAAEWLDRALAGTSHTPDEVERLVARIMP